MFVTFQVTFWWIIGLEKFQTYNSNNNGGFKSSSNKNVVLFGNCRLKTKIFHLPFENWSKTLTSARKAESSSEGICYVFSMAIYRVRHLTFFFQLVFISWMVTLSSCLIWQIISFILPPNEYGCVYAWTTLRSGPAIDLQKIPIFF